MSANINEGKRVFYGNHEIVNTLDKEEADIDIDKVW